MASVFTLPSSCHCRWCGWCPGLTYHHFHPVLQLVFIVGVRRIRITNSVSLSIAKANDFENMPVPLDSSLAQERLCDFSSRRCGSTLNACLHIPVFFYDKCFLVGVKPSEVMTRLLSCPNKQLMKTFLRKPFSSDDTRNQ